MYVIPCLILVYVSISMNFDKEQVTVLFFVYLFITTVFNIFIAKNVCCKDSEEEDLIESGGVSSIQVIKSVIMYAFKLFSSHCIYGLFSHVDCNN